MREFSGVEPLVGEIVALRTFRVDDSGLLLPLYSNGAWYDGANTAACAPPTGDHHRGPHPVPSDDCECGFYAYGTVAAARQNRHTRYVQAVVSCWGGVVAGTQGLRAEHARVDALWLHPEAPRWVRQRVAGRYPSALIYAQADAMLAEHPLTELACYDRPRPKPLLSRVAAVAGLLGLLTLGLLPLDRLRSAAPVWDTWVVVTAAVGLVMAWLALGTHGVGHLAAAFVAFGLFCWLLAPTFGLAGWVLRVPLLRGILVSVGGYLNTLRPHYFPVVATPRERAFCGVRP